MFRTFFGIFVVALATSSCVSTSKPMEPLQDIALPITLCLELNAATATAVARGDTRLRIDIRNRVLSHSYTSALTLSLLHSDGRRSLIHTFGMQPDQIEDRRALAQYFQIALHDVALTPNAQGQVCFELAEEPTTPTTDKKSHKDVSIYWWPITGDKK